MDLLGLIFKRKKDSNLHFSSNEKFDINSLQYDIFQEEEKQATIPRTIYEKTTHLTEKILPIEPDEKAKKEMEEAIDFAHLKVTPKGVYSTALLTAIIFISIGMSLLLLGFMEMMAMFIYAIVVLAFSYYLYNYPFHLKKVYELRAGSEIVMLILHIIIYMRNFPNLEGAVKFASQNLTGPLALDIKKLLWDVHIGVYESMEQAIIAFSIKWKPSFRAFSDSINSIVYSLYTGGNRRMELLDESVDIILTALDERANSYIINLQTPVTMVNALGILLPTLVLTMMPVATIFLKDTIPPYAIFGFYDIILPILLVFIIKNILDQRVITMPEPDLSMHPDLPPEDTFRVGNIFIRCYLPPLLILIPFLYFWYLNWNIDLYGSFIVITGFFISLSVYSYLNSFQKIKIRHEIIEIEDEFRDILFGLGQEMDRGIPLEVGFEKILPTLKGSYSESMIKSILSNMKYEGMTVERAIFDEKVGAILKFPSKLIFSTMKAVIDAAGKSTRIVSEIMISISRYLSNIHRTQNSLQDRFSEVVGSMEMQSRILLPLICAVMNTLTYMIIEMISFFKSTLEGLPTESAAAGYTTFLTLFEGSLSISPGTFQLAIGFYTIETIIILSWFMSGISVGIDKVNLHDTIFRSLVIGGILYLTISMISLVLLIPFLEAIKLTVAM